MPRRERQLDPTAGPLEEFAYALRELRYRAGEPTYHEMARKANMSVGRLSEAAGGKKLPTLETVRAYVKACGGKEPDEREWEERWLRVKARLAAQPRQIAPLDGDDPRRIGPFRLHGKLGAGAMGRVYLGRTPGSRLIAVKVIRPELAEDPLFRRRFRREVDAARRVHGLYIAPLVDADPDGLRPWLATAYVPGPTLRAAVADHGPLPLASLMPLAAGIAEALEAIFAAHVVHRDLKPANVLLAEDGPRVIDFGIAHAVDGTQLTHAGARLGTPGFVAPEQVRGLPVGPAADVFALGGVLTFAATGRPPFGEGTGETVLYRVEHGQPEPGALQVGREEVPPAVDLTALGTTDWVHWGHLESDSGRSEQFVGNFVSEECRHDKHCTNRKRGVSKIGDYTPIGNAAPFRLRNRDATKSFSWRDGEPIVAASGVKSQEYMGLRGNGFRLTAPADRTPRVLTVYLGAYQGKVKCAGSLSDDSAAAVRDDTLNTFGTYNVGRFSTCTFRYRAGSDDQQLTVELTLAEDIGGGNVALYAATLRS